jgi:hypothetical protein
VTLDLTVKVEPFGGRYRAVVTTGLGEPLATVTRDRARPAIIAALELAADDVADELVVK